MHQRACEGLLAALSAVTSWFDECGVLFAVVGGVAASLHGKPRVTKDVDSDALDILVMKALAMRPRDVADIEGILEVVPSLDLERVRTTVALPSDALETDDHPAALDRIIAAQRRRPDSAPLTSSSP